MVENISGLLLERENGLYYFAHLTFQEYLAASYIKERRLGETLVAQVNDPWWRETIRLYCAIEDATPIIAACLESEQQTAAAIQLAIDCDKEAQKVQPEVQVKLETLLLEGIEDPNVERQHVIAEALLTKRLNDMVHLKEETYIDTSLITCAEYQVFLDEKLALGHYFHPNHWSSYRFAPNWGSQPVLGVSRSAATTFCTWLTERETGPWHYRLPKLRELNRESPILDTLSSRIGFWLSETDEFFWSGNPMLVPETIVEEEKEQLYSFIDTVSFKLPINFANSLALIPNLSSSSRNLADDLAELFDLIHEFGNVVNDILANKEKTILLNILNMPIKILNLYFLSPLIITTYIPSRFNFKRNINRIYALVRDRTDNLSLALNLNYGIVEHLPDILPHEIINNADDIRSDFNFAKNRIVHSRVLILTPTITFSRIIRSAVNRAYELNNEIASELAKALVTSSMKVDTIPLAITFCRALFVSIVLEQTLNDSNLIKKRKDIWHQSHLDEFIDFYFGQVILKKRIEGVLPACEGILVVKEKT